jgi:glyoxylase I family protein
MPRVKVHHIALRTTRRRALERFYGELLGLPTIRKTKRSTWLDASGTIVMIEPRGKNEPAVPRGSLELVAFGASKRAHAVLVKKVAEKFGSEAIEASTDFTSYFRDPDGRRVAISHYPRVRRR